MNGNGAVCGGGEGRIVKCIVCKEQVSNTSGPGELGSPSCSAIDKSLTRAFLQSMEANLEELEGLIGIPFCRRCRDKAVLLPQQLLNFQVAYKIFENARRDLAYTAIEAEAEGVEHVGENGSHQTGEEVISHAQDVRKAIMKSNF